MKKLEETRDKLRGTQVFGRRGLEGEELTQDLRHLLEIVIQLDTEFPKILQSLEELERKQEKNSKRLTEISQNIGEIDSKAVSRDEVRAEIESIILEELEGQIDYNKH